MLLIDKQHLNGFMKMWLYQHYVLSFLTWPFMVYDFSVTKVLGLESIANRFLNLGVVYHFPPQCLSSIDSKEQGSRTYLSVTSQVASDQIPHLPELPRPRY